jgi:hypothetical protein
MAWPAAALMGGAHASGARPIVKQDYHCYSPGGGGLNTIQIQTNSNYFKTFQTLTDPKTTFPSPKKLE